MTALLQERQRVQVHSLSGGGGGVRQRGSCIVTSLLSGVVREEAAAAGKESGRMWVPSPSWVLQAQLEEKCQIIRQARWAVCCVPLRCVLRAAILCALCALCPLRGTVYWVLLLCVRCVPFAGYCVLRAATLCAMCALCPLRGTVCWVYCTDAAAHRADAAARAECVEEDLKARKQVVIEQHLERLTQVKGQVTQVSTITICIACKHLSDVELPSVGCCWLSVGCCLLSVCCCWLSVGCCLLSVCCCLLSVGCCLLSVGCCLLSVGCRPLFVICGLLAAVCCLMSIWCLLVSLTVDCR